MDGELTHLVSSVRRHKYGHIILSMKVSRIAKVAGASLVGFCAVSLVADKASVAPMASQVAGFVGAFLGSFVAGRRSRKSEAAITGNQPTRDDSATSGPLH